MRFEINGKEIVVPLGYKAQTKEIKSSLTVKSLRIREHCCDLQFAMTYYNVQGVTLDKIVLSLNPISRETQKIGEIALTNLYVGLSRVHDFAEHRVLTISKDERKKLKTLKQNPHLAEWIKNYDANGKWKHHSFQKQNKITLEKFKTKLALVESDDWSNKEMITFIKELNLIMPKKLRADYKKTLQSTHAKKRKTLLENESRLLKKEQEIWKSILRSKQWKNMNKELLKTYAKCIGIPRNQNTTDTKRRKAIGQILSKKRKCTSQEPKTKKRKYK